MEVIKDLRGHLINQRYKLDTKLGAGTYGKVWAGQDILTNKQIVIKFMQDHKAWSMEKETMDYLHLSPIMKSREH